MTSTVLRFCGYAKTLRINPRTNTPIFRSTPDTLRYQAFTGTIDNFDDKSLLLSEHVITDNKVLDSEGNATDNEYNDEAIPMSDWEGGNISKSNNQQYGHGTNLISGHANNSHYHPYADNAQRLIVKNPQAYLLWWNYRLGHLSLKTIKTMSAVGIFIKRISTEPIPKCVGYMLSAMENMPWRTKVVSVKQLGRKTNINRPG